MGKNQYHTDVECAQIVVLHKIGLSQGQISKQIGVNMSSIQRAIKKFNSEGIYGNRRVVGHKKQLHEMTIPSRGS